MLVSGGCHMAVLPSTSLLQDNITREMNDESEAPSTTLLGFPDACEDRSLSGERTVQAAAVEAVETDVETCPVPSLRWGLSRAGIVNVYQYDKEEIEFGGGRLLLRGVNGAGKSTAMNMLLPFLLTASERNITAASGQSKVLKAWMLDARDAAQTQPVGYLWIEFARADHVLTLGCGIRANRNAQHVDTWWFVTPQRLAASDATATSGTVSVTAGDTPLTLNQLRQALSESDSRVFTNNQRGDYRSEVRRRLFGGADISEHIELLNKLRDPRIGDAIDNKLAEFLARAMPPLSEEAVSAAAEPLQKLEDHRRELAQLERTRNAVDAVLERYGAYCAGDLLLRHDAAASAHQLWCRRARSHDTAKAELDKAGMDIETTKTQASDTQQQIEKCLATIQTLKDTPAYRTSASISELRSSVEGDAARLLETENEMRDRENRLNQTVLSLSESQDRAMQAAVTLQHLLDAAGEDAHAHSLEIGSITTELASSAVEGVETRCFDSLNNDGIESWVSRAATAAKSRLSTLEALTATLEAHTAQRHRLNEAAQAESSAHSATDAAGTDVDAARTELENRQRTWAVESHRWSKSMLKLSSDPTGFGSLLRWSEASEPVPGIHYAAEQAVQRGDADGIVEELVGQRSVVERELHERRSAWADAEDVLEELMRRNEPDPPRQPWQRDGQWCLADVINFNPDVDAEQRAGLEAALEASGLLSARPERDGLRLVAGDLVATCSSAVDAPLSELLHACVPTRLQGQVKPQLVDGILASITTSPVPGVRAGVGVDGRFVVGALAGHHAKNGARLIGAEARRAKLEEDRRHARELLGQATEAVETAEAALTQREAAVIEARDLREQMPEVSEIHSATGAVATAESVLDQTRQKLDQCRHASAAALEEVRNSWTALADAAASLEIPADAESFAATQTELQALRARPIESDPSKLERTDVDLTTSWLNRCDTAVKGIEHDFAAIRHSLCRLIDNLLGPCSHGLETLTLTVSGWESAGGHFMAARDDARRQTSQRDRQRDLLSARQERLAQLEASLSADAEEVLSKIDAAQSRLGIHRSDYEASNKRLEELQSLFNEHTSAAVRADVEEETALRDCQQAATRLVAALRCAGYLSAAGLDSEHHPTVLAAAATTDESVSNLPGLFELLDGRLLGTNAGGAPDADWSTVRRSLEHHRTAMGMWDPHYDPPDETLPLRISLINAGEPTPLVDAARQIASHHDDTRALLATEEQKALRALLEGLIASELADKMHRCNEMVQRMNEILDPIRTAQQIGASLRWNRRGDLDNATAQMVDLLAKPPGMRSHDETTQLRGALSDQLQAARDENPDADYAELIAYVLDYKQWHDMTVFYHRGSERRKLHSRSPLSEGEKKIVTYLALFAALASSYDNLDDSAQGPRGSPRFALLDDAFAKVSADNHADLFGLLVTLDLDFIATSERLWGLHNTIPQLSIVEILRDSRTAAIALERSFWNGKTHEPAT